MILDILNIPGIEASSVNQCIYAKGYAQGLADSRAEGEAKGRAEGEAKGRAEGEAKGRAEGKAEEAREILLSLGQKRLGQPDEGVRVRIAAISDPSRLNRLIHRIFDATTWDDLLASGDQ
jgi:hypothetical protein